MTDILRTLACKTNTEHLIDVHWQHNKSHGRLTINVDAKETTDRHIIAELVAIHHLVVAREICGSNRFGKGLVLAVSSGAIKKLCLGKSSKVYLNRWSNILKFRLRDAQVMVIKTDDWLDIPLCSVESLHVTTPPIEKYLMHGVGPVELTEHVLDRFYERNSNQNYRNALKQLTKELADPALRPITLPAHVLQHKQAKYANHVNIRYFYNTRTNRQFVVTMPPHATPRVLTAYSRANHYLNT